MTMRPEEISILQNPENQKRLRVISEDPGKLNEVIKRGPAHEDVVNDSIKAVRAVVDDQFTDAQGRRVVAILTRTNIGKSDEENAD